LNRKVIVGAVTRQLQVKTLLAGKDLARTLVICKVWKLAMTLQLSVIKSHVLKWSMNSISDPKILPRVTHDSILTKTCSVISFVEHGDGCADISHTSCEERITVM
jgi:hypothetical protein